MDKETKKEFDNLGQILKKSFDHVNDQFDKVENRFDKVENKLDLLERGQDDVKLRLDNMAPYFEVDDLKKRVRKLELKVGLRRA